MSSIDSKVASLREALRSMEEERERLTRVHRKYSNLISLHRAFPSEIWSEIFLYTLSSASDFNAFDASGSIWQLSHVCQRWRNVALSLHSFWSAMDIRFPQGAQQEADVQRLETVIQRSRQGPLDRIFDIVFTESHRWRKARLSYTRGGWDILYAPLHNRLPRLESLALFLAPLEREEQPMSVFGEFPRLTRLTLGQGTPLVVDLPWDQITELDLSWLGVHGGEEERRACMRLIGLCPSLEALALPSWDLEDDEGESPYTPITCSNMRRLHCASVPVIEALTLPRLREAYLHYDILHSFKKLLIRSSCLSALTSLSLTYGPLASSPEHVHSILSQTHSLTLLNLTVFIDEQTDASDRDQIVAIVKSLEVVPRVTVTFLPLLSSLFIRVYNHRDPSNLHYFGPVGSFAYTLKDRWEGDDIVGLARLRTCHFAVACRKPPSTVIMSNSDSNERRNGMSLPHENVSDETYSPPPSTFLTSSRKDIQTNNDGGHTRGRQTAPQTTSTEAASSSSATTQPGSSLRGHVSSHGLVTPPASRSRGETPPYTAMTPISYPAPSMADEDVPSRQSTPPTPVHITEEPDHAKEELDG
ncbi:hypothetical protein BDZ89DRAFT_1135854 [Hymenopellis radicata]|nr:hypothetical protein BDZ89DRAFT_1135854 [Hymenopellis radicata]